MRPLRYSINITLDGCCHHDSVVPDEELHRYGASILARADAVLFGRVTYQMMESAFRDPASLATMPASIQPCSRLRECSGIKRARTLSKRSGKALKGSSNCSGCTGFKLSVAISVSGMATNHIICLQC